MCVCTNTYLYMRICSSRPLARGAPRGRLGTGEPEQTYIYI